MNVLPKTGVLFDSPLATTVGTPVSKKGRTSIKLECGAMVKTRALGSLTPRLLISVNPIKTNIATTTFRHHSFNCLLVIIITFRHKVVDISNLRISKSNSLIHHIERQWYFLESKHFYFNSVDQFDLLKSYWSITSNKIISSKTVNFFNPNY